MLKQDAVNMILFRSWFILSPFLLISVDQGDFSKTGAEDCRHHYKDYLAEAQSNYLAEALTTI
jgi:hypothetical protein